MVNHHSSTSDAASTPLGASPSNPDRPEDSTPRADLDAMFAALDHSRRRHLLSALIDRKGEQPLDRLATDVVAREDDESREDVTEAARRRCRVTLHHVHVPKLAALGIVDYDPDGEPTVRAADTDGVTAVLDGIDGGSRADQATLHQRDGA